MRRPWNLSLYLGLLAMVAAGCGQGGDAAVDETAAEIKSIQDTLNNEENSSLFSTDLFVEDPGGMGLSSESAGNTKSITDSMAETHPVFLPRWYREITEIERNVKIRIQEERADVEVTTELSGVLHLDLNGDGQFGTKAIQSIARRFAAFERLLPGHWRLAEISPVEFSLAEPALQTIQVERVTAAVNDEVRWDVTDPSALLPFPSGLPIFSPGEAVVVTAEVTHVGPDGEPRASVVFLHHNGWREPMYDDGTNGGDAVAGDGIFTLTRTVGPGLGFHHAAVDALDAGVFSDEITQNYNAAGWGIPYIVANAYTGTMYHLDIEGGCWQFVTDEGEQFEPFGGSPDLYRDGQRATLIGFTPEYLASICQVGRILRVIRFEVLS